ncbi:MAG: ribosomal RNA small subunit methyltransferase A [Armatimonadia bacterium]|nr:ribosomal RNA small subunit methyltransferase A [Armatimonadia bacterium]
MGRGLRLGRRGRLWRSHQGRPHRFVLRLLRRRPRVRPQAGSRPVHTVSDLTPSQRVRQALAAAGHDPLKALSQNFLTDPNILRHIGDAACVAPGDHVLEIGPGPGVLTVELLARGAKVRAVELDGGLAGYLQDAFRGRPLEVIRGDVLEMDLAELVDGDRPWTVASNLPYSISTPFMYELATVAHRLERAVLTLQREVAERACAPAGHPARGAVSAVVRRRLGPAILRRIPASAFHPPPRVESALLELVPSDRAPEEATAESYRTLVRAAFGQRRKTLVKALAMGPDAIAKAEALAVVAAAGLSGRERAEEIGEEEFDRMARELDRLRGLGP